MTVLQAVWFFLIGLLLAGYAVLDGFDLGVGCWHLLHLKSDRKILLASIAPVWDGNEVWLLAAGGALFAAFPAVYAASFSAMYPAMLLVLVGLILRAAALEFRNQVSNERWQTFWDWCFSLGSIVPALLVGVAIGNVLRGLPLDAAGDPSGTFLDLLNPFALLVGITGLAMLATHGALYLAVKTRGGLSGDAARTAKEAWLVLLLLWLASTLASLFVRGDLWANLAAHPAWCGLPIGQLLLLAGIRHCLGRGEHARAFLLSSLFIVGAVGVVGLALWPNLLPASNDPALSLTIANSASSETTLGAMLIVALIGMPFVVLYTVIAYRTFRGKASPEDLGY